MLDALVKTTAVMRAREALPPKYSDLGRTLLKVQVGSQGGSSFNFAVKAEVPAAAAAQDQDGETRPTSPIARRAPGRRSPSRRGKGWQPLS